jgi:septum formation protein
VTPERDAQLVLASTSTARAQLLARLELEFEQVDPAFDERAADPRFDELGPEAFAALLAQGKAQAAAALRPGRVILAADQIAVLDHRLLTKPGSVGGAVDQLMNLAGETHELITAVHVHDGRTAEDHRAADRHRLTMRAFSREEATAYVERHRPLECAGSYRIEDAGIKLFERIEGGDYTSIIGLPLLSVARLLRTIGLLPAN